jgi:hypothetical protein
MLRKISLIAAVAAILAIPTTQASARMGGHGGGHGGHWGGGGMRMGHVGGFGRVGGFGVHRAGFARGAFIGHRRGVFFARHHFRNRFFFAGVGLYGYSSCWRWVPTAYGLQRAWVCDYPYGYY